jgi:glucosamine 6-phosphate synthetase-like amidotransferase/phosphosugar isomerase protein
LGKGYGEPVAMEGALKIKEMCYLHAEGYSGGALKHGPFTLIKNAETGIFGATPIIMIILDDNHASMCQSYHHSEQWSTNGIMGSITLAIERY